MPIIIGVAIFLPVIIVLFIFGFGRRYRLWMLGQTDNRFDRWRTRLIGTLAVAIANVRIVRLKELYPGLMHTFIFAGTALLFLGKIIRIFSFGGVTTPPQSIFLYASLISEIGGVLILIGGGMAIYRRYIRKPPRLDTVSEDTLIYFWGFLLILTGFMIKGFRIATSEVNPTDWAMWSPVGYLFSHAFPIFVTEATNEILVWHRTLFHVIPAFIILGYIWVIRSRLQHLLISPLNVFFRSLKPKGALTPIALKTAKTFGAANIESFTWKQLLDLDACVRCGRCQDACPATASGKPLNPKNVIQNLKTHLYEVYPIPWVRKPIDPRPDMLTEVVTEDEIWACTTCRACQEVCPIWVEHIDKIIDVRRNLVMGSKSEAARDPLRNIRQRGHPWLGTTLAREDWTQGLDIKILAEDSNVDILYWVGCTEALEDRSIKIAQAMGKLLKQAGVNFGILGEEESCCGDPARRLGNERQFQLQAQKNIKTMQGYNVKKIVTACPHCYNTIKHEYPQFGGEFEVIHHTEFIAELIKENKLKVARNNGNVITYQDPCYLGRYNDIYQPPRQILNSIPDTTVVEMQPNRERSFCCGGGGGRMWLEENIGQRISEMRIDRAIETNA